MKNKLIIVHGATALSSKNKIIQKIISNIYKYIFNYIPEYNKINPWINKFSKSEFEIIEFKWDGKIIPYDIPKASQKLSEILKLSQNQNIFFLTESIGTEITLSAIQKLEFKDNIKKIVSICPVNKPRTINDFSMTILNSKSDTFANFANKFLWPSKMFKKLNGDIENIKLENIRHDQFLPNFKINNKETLLNLIKNKFNEYEYE